MAPKKAADDNDLDGVPLEEAGEAEEAEEAEEDQVEDEEEEDETGTLKLLFISESSFSLLACCSNAQSFFPALSS